MKCMSPVLLALLLLPACSLFNPWAGSGEIPDDIQLVNQTGEPLYFSAWELEASHLVDPLPSFDPESGSPFPEVAPGASASVDDITGYRPGDDVRFFIYALRQEKSEETAGQEVAKLVSVLTVRAEELRQSGGRVVVSEL